MSDPNAVWPRPAPVVADDLGELERLARESICDAHWFTEDDLHDTRPGPADRAYIAAASPDVILRLIARLRAAESTKP